MHLCLCLCIVAHNMSLFACLALLLQLYLMSGDFLGTDQEFEVPLTIREGKEDSDEESMGEE